MVKERAPPKVLPRQPQDDSQAASRRDTSPEDDTDITAVVNGWTSVGSGYSGVQAGSSAATDRPAFGHPTKMTSSFKQKAKIFIHQKTRPEHHPETKVSGPRPSTYQDRMPRPMPVFSSIQPSASASLLRGEEVFYTNPAQASADLKALLEGGMDEDEEGDGDEGGHDKAAKTGNTEVKSTGRPDERSGEGKRKMLVDDSGTVDGLKVRLLPHQVEGVNWMCGRELGPVKRGRVPKGGLLADDMGLGKTLQTVTTMLTNRKPQKEDDRWKKHFEGVEKTSLVVAPLALIRQWESELRDKVAPSARLKVLVHHGPQRTKDPKELAQYDVVITTYQILVSEHGKSADAQDGPKTGCFGLHWWRVVLDEAHTIKNRNAKTTKACYGLRCEYRWCLSGTPLQNNLDELQSLIRFLRIKPYDDLKQWKEHIDSPLKNGNGHVAIQRLHSLLRCFMKRRTKNILKEEGALNHGGKPSESGDGESTTGFRHTERNVVTVTATLSPAERGFYDRLEERADRSIEAMMKDKLSYANAFTLLLRLRQACNHPKLVERKLDKDKDALSTWGAGPKKHEADVDAMADLLAEMDLAAKNCSICGKDLTSANMKGGREHCSECDEDLERFGRQEAKKTKRTKKKKKTKEVANEKKGEGGRARPEDGMGSEEDDGENKQEAEVQAPAPAQAAPRRRRARKAVIDSDDEEDAEGNWLVPEEERGKLQLGKAGGSEDEDAEGGGDWIGSEDSADETADASIDRRELGSFVDETAHDEEGCSDAAVTSYGEDDDSSLLSVSAMTKMMAAQTLDDDGGSASGAGATERGSASDAASDSDSGSASSGSDTDGDPAPVPASSKIRELRRLLAAEAGAHKFIVFSQFTSMLDLVEPFLRRDGLCFCRYDGKMRNEAREESLRRLREDGRVRVMLCSLKCGSLGLNLMAATRVVIIEPFWNPFVEEQAIDRVHRLNQTADVTVYKLTVADTVEARILGLQDRKRQLTEQTIEGGAKKGALKLGLHELVDLFRTAAPAASNEDNNNGDHDAVSAAMLALCRRDRRAPAAAHPSRPEYAAYARRW